MVPLDVHRSFGLLALLWALLAGCSMVGGRSVASRPRVEVQAEVLEVTGPRRAGLHDLWGSIDRVAVGEPAAHRLADHGLGVGQVTDGWPDAILRLYRETRLAGRRKEVVHVALGEPVLIPIGRAMLPAARDFVQADVLLTQTSLEEVETLLEVIVAREGRGGAVVTITPWTGASGTPRGPIPFADLSATLPLADGRPVVVGASPEGSGAGELGHAFFVRPDARGELESMVILSFRLSPSPDVP